MGVGQGHWPLPQTLPIPLQFLGRKVGLLARVSGLFYGAWDRGWGRIRICRAGVPARLSPWYLSSQKEKPGVDHHRRGKDQAVQAIQHAAVARQQLAGILNLSLTLQHRLEQIAQNAHQGQNQG